MSKIQLTLYDNDIPDTNNAYEVWYDNEDIERAINGYTKNFELIKSTNDDKVHVLKSPNGNNEKIVIPNNINHSGESFGLDSIQERLKYFMEMQKDDNASTHFIVPINLENSHWVGLVVHHNLIGGYQYTYTDSLSGNNGTIPKEIDEAMNQLDLIINSKPIQSDQQQNGYDCGPYAVHNMLKAAGLDFQQINSEKGLREEQYRLAPEIYWKHAKASKEKQISDLWNHILKPDIKSKIIEICKQYINQENTDEKFQNLIIENDNLYYIEQFYFNMKNNNQYNEKLIKEIASMRDQNTKLEYHEAAIDDQSGYPQEEKVNYKRHINQDDNIHKVIKYAAAGEIAMVHNTLKTMKPDEINAMRKSKLYKNNVNLEDENGRLLDELAHNVAVNNESTSQFLVQALQASSTFFEAGTNRNSIKKAINTVKLNKHNTPGVSR
ncbi:MAG: Ulp1 family isopeptidase [Rickettsiaceae bacterium]